jgi:hypothetical protein
MRAQEAAEETGRALKFPVSDGTGLAAEIPSSVARADRVLAFDGAGAPVASSRTLGEIEGQIDAAEGFAEDAAASAGAAAGAAVEAGLHAVNAEAGAEAAADSADDAATSLAAAGLPDPAVAGTYLRRDVGNTAYEARTPDEVRADIGAASGAFQGALVRKTSNQTIPHNTTTVLSWDAEEYDTDNIHDNATNNTRLTVPSGATHVRVNLGVIFASNNVGERFISVIKNGGAFNGRAASRKLAASFSHTNVSTPVLEVTDGDYFEATVIQTSGADLDVLTAAEVWFAVEIVR